MKKSVIIISALMLMSFASIAQKVEVFYFKAELSCCQAKACNAIEEEVKAVVEKNFASDKVAFTEVKIADEQNSELVEKHNAKSQTVVIVSKKKKKETASDISDIIRKYSRSKNKEEFEKELVAKITESLK